MIRELAELFDAGTLVRPGAGRADLVDVSMAVASLAGVRSIERAGRVAELTDTIGSADHLVFVLCDGLGMNLIRRLPGDAFLCRHLRGELDATCPSTTACALTSVATARHPCVHGITGWFTHVPELDLTATTLPFVERFTAQPLAQRGLSVSDLIRATPIYPHMTQRPLILSPTYIADTPYNCFVRGGVDGAGYKTTTDAVRQIIERVATADEPTFTYLYIPEVDTLCHHVGVGHADVLPLVMHIDAELRRLADELAGRARIVVTADHGLIDVPKNEQALVFPGDPLLDLLDAPPSGDARMPIFHVKPGRDDAFVESFARRFGDRIALVDVDQAERLRLFGPTPLAADVRRRFGRFIGFPFRAATLAFHPGTQGKAPANVFIAVHGGLSDDEMRVPLCVA